MGKWVAVLICVLLICFTVACGGKNTPQVPAPSPVVTATATPATVLVRAPSKITATVSGASDSSVKFSVLEAGGGQVSANGDYVAPGEAGVYHVRAASVAAPTRFADVAITVGGYTKMITRTADMADARDFHTASFLADGSVLIVGGAGFSGMRALSERFVPGTTQFAPSATLAQPRVQHAAAVLPSGKVLVTGGYNPLGGGTPFDAAFKTSEIYDRTTDTFTAGPEMIAPRRWHQMVTLKDGRVLVTGGVQLIGSGFGASPKIEMYDPNSNLFVDKGNLNEGRWLHTTTVLNDGRVLIVGGRSNNCTDSCPMYSLATAEIFDPVTGTITSTGSLNIGRHAHSAVLLTDGRVLVIGGESYNLPDSDQIGTGEVYDPATGLWQTWGTLLGGRSYFTMTLLNDGKYLVAGGKNWNGTIVGTTEIFDVSTGNSIFGPQMNDWRIRHTATRLQNGEVLIIGGSNSGAPVLAVDIYR